VSTRRFECDRTTNLTSLDLRKTKAAADGVKKLAAALPQCKIEWDGGVIEASKK